MLLDLNILLFLGLIALMTGFVKTGLPALGGFISVLMVLVFPPKDALGITLCYLLAGDSMAVSFYWRQANRSELKRLLPMIFIGVFSGILVLTLVDNALLGLIIGIMIVFFVSLERFRQDVTEWSMRHLTWVRALSGWLAGLTTTVGNAAGPVLSLYFLLIKLDKHGFAGTAAMFFLVVNLTKIPLYSAIGLFKGYYLWSVLLTLPLVYVGGFLGRRFLQWIPQKRFSQAILFFTGLAGAVLIIRYFMGLNVS